MTKLFCQVMTKGSITDWLQHKLNNTELVKGSR